jgi:hypothetical protein
MTSGLTKRKFDAVASRFEVEMFLHRFFVHLGELKNAEVGFRWCCGLLVLQVVVVVWGIVFDFCIPVLLS